MNDINRVDMDGVRRSEDVDFSPKVQQGLLKMGEEGLEKLPSELGQVEGDRSDISSLARSLDSLLERLELGLRDAIFTSLSLMEEAEANQDLLEDLKAILKDLEALDLKEGGGDLEKLGKKLGALDPKLKNLLSLNIGRSRENLEALKSKDGQDQEGLEKGEDGRQGEKEAGEEGLVSSGDRLAEEDRMVALENRKIDIKKNRIGETRKISMAVLEEEIEELEEIFDKLDLSMDTRNRLEGDIDRLKKEVGLELLKLEDLDPEGLDEEGRLVLREIESSLEREVGLVKEKIEDLLEILEGKDGKLSRLIHRSREDQGIIEEDELFKKFKLDGDRDYRERLYLEVLKEREEKLRTLEEDSGAERAYREGRRDLSLGLKIVEIVRSKGISLKEVLVFMGIIFFLVLFLRLVS